MTDEQVCRQIADLYRHDAHADVHWCALALLRVLEVVAAHEAAADGEQLGWVADIRHAINPEVSA